MQCDLAEQCIKTKSINMASELDHICMALILPVRILCAAAVLISVVHVFVRTLLQKFIHQCMIVCLYIIVFRYYIDF